MNIFARMLSLFNVNNLNRDAMSLQNNLSIGQFILGCVTTLITVLVICFGAYVSIKVDSARLETKQELLEKRVDRTDEKFDKIMDKLTELEVKIGK